MITPGMIIANRYEVIGKVGAGGMADVYKAKDHTLGRFVAIKVLKEEFSEDVNFVTKFRTEASSAAGLEHPNIVNIYDVGSESDFHYIVMELVEGITLKTYIEKKGQLSFKEAVSIAIQVGRGIEAAHNKNIIHRDIKPQNIIISTEGKVKVTDFGIARATTQNTINSDVMGSVHYTSPEQARNGFVDGKSDIYSLGIVMYEMVTGRVPFSGDTTVAVAIQHLQEEMESPKTYAQDLPVSLEKIILKCTQKNPDRRYENITALLSDLRKALINPTEDFVVIAPIPESKTRVINVDEVKKNTGNVYVDEAALVEGTMGDVDADLDEDEYEDEEEINPMMDKAITIMGIVAGVVIVILIIVILANFLGGFGKNKDNTETQQNTTTVVTETQKETETEKGIEIVDLSGLTYEDAKELLNDLGLGIRRAGTVASDEYAEGEIVSHTPGVGEYAQANDTIEVIVSSGPARIEIPNVKGLDEDTATKKLTDAGFKVSVDEKYSDTVEKGLVVSQTPSGTSMANEGDMVIIVISKGPEMIKIPDVKGKAKADAKKALVDAGFEVVEEEQYSDEVAAGNVISMSPAADSLANKGDKITIVVSKGKQFIAVPNVVGKSEADAKTAITNAGLKVGTVTTQTSTTVNVGVVFDQSVPADTSVAPGTVIDITVSAGVNVPNVVGKALGEAEKAITDSGLKCEVSSANSDAVASGLVISQDVTGAVNPGTTVKIVVSLGPTTPTGGTTGSESTGGTTSGDATGGTTSGGTTSGDTTNGTGTTTP